MVLLNDKTEIVLAEKGNTKEKVNQKPNKQIIL